MIFCVTVACHKMLTWNVEIQNIIWVIHPCISRVDIISNTLSDNSVSNRPRSECGRERIEKFHLKLVKYR